MVVRIVYENGKHDNFYEGDVISFHSDIEIKDEKFLEIIIEGPKDSITVDCAYGVGTRIYLMNNQGKTVESKCI